MARQVRDSGWTALPMTVAPGRAAQGGSGGGTARWPARRPRRGASSSRTLSCVDRSELAIPTAVRIDLLGPLRLYVGDREVTVPALRPRALLGLLAIRANAVVQSDRLIDELWDGVVTPGAAVTLRSYISVLRRAFYGASAGADSVLATAAAGYRIDLEADHIDAHRLRRLVGEGHEHLRRACPHEALGSFETALGLWRGLPLAELGDHTAAAPFRAEMSALRASATDGRLRALVEAGRHHEAIPALESLVRTEPLREEPYELLVLAFHRAGRTPEALEVHQRFRALLREQLGIDPSPAFAGLQSAILSQDPRLDQPAGAARSIPMIVAGPARPHVAGRAHGRPDRRPARGSQRPCRASAICRSGPRGDRFFRGRTRLCVRGTVRIGGGYFAPLVARRGPAPQGAQQVRDRGKPLSLLSFTTTTRQAREYEPSHPDSTEFPPGRNQV